MYGSITLANLVIVDFPLPFGPAKTIISGNNFLLERQNLLPHVEQQEEKGQRQGYRPRSHFQQRGLPSLYWRGS